MFELNGEVTDVKHIQCDHDSRSGKDDDGGARYGLTQAGAGVSSLMVASFVFGDGGEIIPAELETN